MSTTIKQFRVDGKRFSHVIHVSTDDRVELLNEAGDVILTFTADCKVNDRTGQRVGRFGMDHRDSKWYFQPEGDDELKFVYGTDILDAEVEVSKLYIMGIFDKDTK